jgi:hypothetical protein
MYTQLPVDSEDDGSVYLQNAANTAHSHTVKRAKSKINRKISSTIQYSKHHNSRFRIASMDHFSNTAILA